MRKSILAVMLLVAIGQGVFGQSKSLIHIMDSVETAKFNKQPHMFLMTTKNGKPDSSLVIYGDTITNIRNLWREYRALQKKHLGLINNSQK